LTAQWPLGVGSKKLILLKTPLLFLPYCLRTLRWSRIQSKSTLFPERLFYGVRSP
jgi:hypothetical protein